MAGDGPRVPGAHDVLEGLSRHVTLLGGLSAGAQFTSQQLAAISTAAGAPIPPALRWWWSTYGGGNEFVDPIVYDDPRERIEVVLAWFLDVDGVLSAIADDPVTPRRFPFHADEMDNLFTVDRDGTVWEHIHDAPLDRRAKRLSSSFEAFMSSLHRPTD